MGHDDVRKLYFEKHFGRHLLDFRDFKFLVDHDTDFWMIHKISFACTHLCVSQLQNIVDRNQIQKTKKNCCILNFFLGSTAKMIRRKNWFQQSTAMKRSTFVEF